MIQLDIPGRGVLELKNLVLDFNGTIAFDGQILPEVATLLGHLSLDLKIFVLTADTFGTAAVQCEQLPVTLHRLTSDNHTQEKGDFVEKLGGSTVVAFGNGRNDQKMLENAAIGVGVINDEGCAGPIFHTADLLICGIERALELLVERKRLIATLRQ